MTVGDVIDGYLAAARAGDEDAIVAVADLIRRADRQDLAKEANSWLAAKKSSDDGAVEYARALYAFHGFGQRRDHARALALHEEAAHKGHGDAMFELYAMYARGLGTDVDTGTAVGWCIRAAEAGNARAMANLGGFYLTGNGVDKDVATGVTWYDRAASLGHGKAAATLGLMFATGSDVEHDTEKATHYLALAEEHGFDWRPLAAQLGL